MPFSKEAKRAFAREQWDGANKINPHADQVRKILFMKGYDVYMEKFERGISDEYLRRRLHAILSQDLEEFNKMMSEMSELGFSV